MGEEEEEEGGVTLTAESITAFLAPAKTSNYGS